MVGFTGWADEAFILGKIRNENIAGVFQVRQQLYVSKSVSATNSESVVLFLEMLESHLLKDTAKVKVISNYFRDFPEID